MLQNISNYSTNWNFNILFPECECKNMCILFKETDFLFATTFCCCQLLTKLFLQEMIQSWGYMWILFSPLN